ncbi:MAG: CHAT domain-containing protein [Myxococcales bacterium]|nr:CHAT domain-containing protein [Myxococcales bacterium]
MAGVDEPIRILLWFVRKDESHDPFAFRFERQLYNVLDERGVVLRPSELPWDASLMHTLAALREPSPPQRVLDELGALLSEFLEPAGWAHHSKAIVAAKGARTVYVTIRAAAAELFALPWELLTIKETQERLGALDHVVIRYEWPGTATVPPRVTAPAASRRVLLAWAGDVPASEHEDAIRSREPSREVDLEVLPHASYTRVAQALAEAEGAGRPFQVLHLLCHGAVTEDGSYGLALAAGEDAEPGATLAIAPASLQKLISNNAGALRLVVVAACDSGSARAPGSRAGSVAQRMHQAGVQAVVASRYPLSTAGSVRMARALYRALLEREQTVEEAVIAARVAVDDGASFDWASLQLYARASDGEGVSPWPPAVNDPVPTVTSSPPAARAWVVPAIGLGLALAVGVGIYGLSRLGAGAAGDDAAASAAAPDHPSRTPEASPEPAPGETSSRPEQAPTDAGVDPPPNDLPGEPGELAAVAPSSDSSATHDATGDASPAEDDAQPGTSVTRKSSKTSRTSTPATSESSCASATRACPEGLKQAIEAQLDAPTGGGSYSLRAHACVDGGVTVKTCSGCSDALLREAKGRARSVRASVVKSKGKELPCYAAFRWD